MSPQTIKKIIEEKVIGKVKPDHDAYGHHYLLPSGTRVDSVTTKNVLDKPHLLNWAVKVGVEWLEKNDRFARLNGPEREATIKGAQMACKDIRDDAGNIGSIVHSYVEEYINKWLRDGIKPESFIDRTADYRVIAGCRAIEALFVKHNIVPIASELLVGDERMNSAGTLDFLCFWDGKLTLVDWKTSNAVDPIGYSMQTAAYKKMFERMTGLRIKECKIVLISKYDDRVSVYKLSDAKSALKAFMNLSKVYDWVSDRSEKVYKDIKQL